METLGIYLSVPFCKAKCSFCNFASGVFAPGRMQGYVARLGEEIGAARGYAERLGLRLPQQVNSIYFGGGTPSLLQPEMIAEIFAALRGQFALDADAEVTVECAPGQVADQTLEALQRSGMNRLSFGVQSFVDAEAAAVGRLHTGAGCRRELARMQAAGVARLAIDLIVGLPGQTLDSWRYTVEQAVESGVEHVSVYMLEVDEGSRLGGSGLPAVPATGPARCRRKTASPTGSWLDARGWRRAAWPSMRSQTLRARVGRRGTIASTGSVLLISALAWMRIPCCGMGCAACAGATRIPCKSMPGSGFAVLPGQPSPWDVRRRLRRLCSWGCGWSKGSA